MLCKFIYKNFLKKKVLTSENNFFFFSTIFKNEINTIFKILTRNWK